MCSFFPAKTIYVPFKVKILKILIISSPFLCLLHWGNPFLYNVVYYLPQPIQHSWKYTKLNEEFLFLFFQFRWHITCVSLRYMKWWFDTCIYCEMIYPLMDIWKNESHSWVGKNIFTFQFVLEICSFPFWWYWHVCVCMPTSTPRDVSFPVFPSFLYISVCIADSWISWKKGFCVEKEYRFLIGGDKVKGPKFAVSLK